MAATFYLSDHQFKGLAYSRALIQAGFERREAVTDPELVLAMFDHDVGIYEGGVRNGLGYLHERGVPVFLYPHSARPMVQYDGVYTPWRHTACRFAMSEGEIEVMRAFGYEIAMSAVGWSFCALKPFKRRKAGERIQVLFGPIHPNNNGWLSDVDKACNQRAFDLLLKTPGIDLTVRHVKRIDLSGVRFVPGVRYVLGRTDGALDEIDQADVVIGHQTFAYLAAARGKPVIMFGDQVIPHVGNRPNNLRYVKHYERYRELMRYPVEMETMESGAQLRDMMARIMWTNAGREWRLRMIGGAFDEKNFIETVRNYL